MYVHVCVRACVWGGVVWRGVVWCGVVWCGVVWCACVCACERERERERETETETETETDRDRERQREDPVLRICMLFAKAIFTCSDFLEAKNAGTRRKLKEQKFTVICMFPTWCGSILLLLMLGEVWASG